MANFKLEPIVLQNVNRTFMGQLTQLQNEKAVLTTQIETLEEDLQRMQKEYATALITNTTKLMKKDSTCSKFDTSALEQALALLKERLAQMTNEITALESVIESIKAIVNLVVTTDEEGASIVNSKMTVTDIMPLSSMEVAKSNAMSGYSNLTVLQSGVTVAGNMYAYHWGNLHNGTPNVAASTPIALTDEQLSWMTDSCDRIKTLYNEGDYPEDLKNYINAYLTPELLTAVAGTESGYFNVDAYNNLKGGGMGITSSGASCLRNCLGGENMNYDGAYYHNNNQAGIDAATTLLGESIRDNYYRNQSGKVFNAEGTINEGQLLFDALYQYGAGNFSSYNAGEAGMSTGYKMYAYYNICNQTGGNCAIGYTNDLEGTLSAYTDQGSGNQWQYTVK